MQIFVVIYIDHMGSTHKFYFVVNLGLFTPSCCICATVCGTAEAARRVIAYHLSATLQSRDISIKIFFLLQLILVLWNDLLLFVWSTFS